MTDLPTPPGDPGDEHLAALLRVDPLDELTRHRLVTVALRESSSTRHARLLVAAIVALATLAGGTALVIGLRGGGSSTPTAAPRAATVGPKAGSAVAPPS